MQKLEVHPTVRKFRQQQASAEEQSTQKQFIDSEWLKTICLKAGADDVGFVPIDHPGLSADRDSIRKYLPWARSLIGIVCKMNREPIRSTARSIANLEFHRCGDEINHTASRIVEKLEEEGIRAINPSMGFPMEMDNFPGKIWVISHKLVAVAAGLGKMGIHRNVIHPRFGNFILLGTIALDREVERYSRELDFNPCLECKLCVSACPVGAIGSGGEFNFSSCYNHNYKEFMGGFTNWVEDIASSRDEKEYRYRVNDPETVSQWQSLSYGANYKAAYCMAVCPAGEDVISPFLEKRPKYLKEVVRPLQEKPEPVYVVKESDAEEYTRKRYPNKTLRTVKNGLRPVSIDTFVTGLPLIFQPEQSKGLSAVYHFTFTGKEKRSLTITINNKMLFINDGHVGEPDLRATIDSKFWVAFLRQEKRMIWGLMTGKVRIHGTPVLLLKFGKCFPA